MAETSFTEDVEILVSVFVRFRSSLTTGICRLLVPSQTSSYRYVSNVLHSVVD